MGDLITNFGTLKGVYAEIYDDNDFLQGCMVNKYCELVTPYGTLIPKYSTGDVRTKYRNALSFYSSGVLKSIYLENKSMISTKIGKINAELLTFYEDGTIHRIFPQYGQVNGYWTEENEYEYSEKIQISLPSQTCYTKILQVCFYKEGNIKSLTLWKKDRLIVKVGEKEVTARIGISFYKSGVIKSLEPSVPIKIATPIGSILAYQTSPLGIHGDKNSLCYYEDGNVKSLFTASNRLVIKDGSLKTIVIEPELKPSQLDQEIMDLVPIQIIFEEMELQVIDSDKNIHSFQKNLHKFQVEEVSYFTQEGNCSNCTSCGKC